MTARSFPIAALFLSVALLVGCGNSDERRILAVVDEIQGLVSKTPTESNLAGLAAAHDIAAFFTDPFTVVAEPAGLTTRDRRQLIGVIHQYRNRSSALFMRLYNENLVIEEGRERAQMSLTAEFVDDLADLAGAERYLLDLQWRRIDGKWLIERAEVRAGG